MALFQRVVSRSLQLSWLRAWPSRWWPGRKERHGAVRVLLVCDECLARATSGATRDFVTGGTGSRSSSRIRGHLAWRATRSTPFAAPLGRVRDVASVGPPGCRAGMDM